MEIIKRGKLPEELTYTGECYRCGTVAIAKGKELQLSYDVKEHQTYGVAKCPVCGWPSMTFYKSEISDGD